MSIITRINKAEKRIVDLYNKLKNLPSGGEGVQTISGDFVDNTDPLNPILNDPRPYKVYTALLTQSGTDAPVATVLQNTLGGEVVWNYEGVGNYSAISTNLFTENKTSVLHKSIIGDDPNYLLQSYSILTSSITFSTLEIGTGLQDSILLQPELIEIRVYN